MRKVLEITFAGENYRTVLAESAETPSASCGPSSPRWRWWTRPRRPERLRLASRSSARPRRRVIILSSKQQPYDKARGAPVGADDFIDKPFDTQQLIDKVSARSAKRGRGSACRAAHPQPLPAQPVARLRSRPTAHRNVDDVGRRWHAPSAQSPTPTFNRLRSADTDDGTGTAPARSPSPAAPAVAAAPVAPVSSAAPDRAVAPAPVTARAVPATEPAASATRRPQLGNRRRRSVAASSPHSGSRSDQVQAVLSLSRAKSSKRWSGKSCPCSPKR